MEKLGPKYRRLTREECVIEHLKRLRKPLKRASYERRILPDAIELLQERQELDEVGELFRLWGLQDPRG